MAYIPSLADIPQTSQSANVSQLKSNNSYTPSLSDIPEVKNKTGTLGKLYAGASGFLNGSLEAAHATGELASNILRGAVHLGTSILDKPEAEENFKKGMELIENVGNKSIEGAKEFLKPKSEFEQTAINENIPLNAAAKTAAFIPGMIAGGGIVAKPIGLITKPLAEAAPVLSKSPMLSGTADSFAQNAAIGAAANPDNPLLGGIEGGIAGAITHGVTGPTSYKINKSGSIIDQEIKNAKLAGIDPGSHTSIYNIQAALKNEGVNLRSVEIKNAVQKQSSDLIDTIRPDNYNPKESPINVVSKAAAENFPAQVERSKVLYAPINNSKQLVQTPSFNESLAKIPENTLKKVSMPEPLSQDGNTLNTLLGQRFKLDATLAQTKNLMRNGKITATEAQPIFEARQALNKDIHDNAINLGLTDQLNKAEQHYNEVIRPFQVYNKNLGQLKQMEPGEIQGKIWKDLNKQLQTRFPDPNKLKQIASTLGENGKELLSWAKIENDFKVSTVNGIFNPTTFGTRISKSANSGLNDLIMTNEQKEVVTGLQKLGQAARQILPKPSQEKAGILTKTIQHFMYSRPGIQLLKILGNPNTSSQGIRSIAQQILEGTIAIGASASSDQE